MAGLAVAAPHFGRRYYIVLRISGWASSTVKSSTFSTVNMPDQLNQLPLPLPDALRQWLTVNVEFHVVLCHAADCQHALTPASTSRHLRDKHQAKIEVQRQADKYIKQWQWLYDFRSVPLPPDQSLPQPGLPVSRGFQCTKCGFTSQSRKILQTHRIREHNQKRLKDRQPFKPVQLQTWFSEKRARY